MIKKYGMYNSECLKGQCDERDRKGGGGDPNTIKWYRTVPMVKTPAAIQ